MAKLKRCPFCGGEAVVMDLGPVGSRYYVACSRCRVAQEKLYYQKCDAVRAWNKRTGEGENDEDMNVLDKWIPVRTRPMDEEERKYYHETLGWDLTDDEAVMFESLMPGDGQEVWVCSKNGSVWQDTCLVEEGIGLEENGDWMDIVAWMPFGRPEPWKGEVDG